MNLQALLQEMQARTVKGHSMAWRPFGKEESELLRSYHLQHAIKLLPEWARDGQCFLANRARPTNTIISKGFERIAVGDYGAYLEIHKEDMFLQTIEQRWPGPPSRPVKYIWMQTKDNVKTKIYFQQAPVSYANYKPGMYYVDPRDIAFMMNLQ